MSKARADTVKLTRSSGKRAAEWAKEILGLQAWSLKLYVTNDPPADWYSEEEACGRTVALPQETKVEIWVSPSRCRRDDIRQPLHVLFHEMAHVFYRQAGVPMASQSVHWEVACNRLADVLLLAYERKEKQP